MAKQHAKRRDPVSFMLRLLVRASACIATGALVALVGYVLIQGLRYMKPSLFAWTYTSDNVSLVPALINTVVMTVLALIISVPFAIGTAIYLVEYAKRGSKLVSMIRLTTETLSGIPSIVYGLFGMLFFVTALGWRLSLLAGVILAIGRIVGETAALLYTAGTATRLPDSIMKSGRTLSVHMYVLSNEGLHIGEAYATAAVLLIIVFAMNTLSAMVAKKIARGSNG